MSAARNFTVTPGPAVTLASGAPAAGGDVVKGDPDDPHTKRLIDSERLVETPTKRKSSSDKKEGS